MRAYSSERMAEAAKICGEVYGREPYARAVTTRLGLSLKQARNLIHRARQAGHDIPDDLKTWRYAFPTPRLVCECGVWSCPVDAGITGLQRHTLTEHGRVASTIEKTPRAVAA